MLSKLGRITSRTPKNKGARLSSTSLSGSTPPNADLTREYRNHLASIQSGKERTLDLRKFASFSSSIASDLAKVIGKGTNCNITSVNFSGMELGIKIINEIMRILGLSESIGSVTSIDLSRNAFNINEADALVEALPKMSSLRDIILDGNSLTSLTKSIDESTIEEGHKDFFGALGSLASIRTLGLNAVIGVGGTLEQAESSANTKLPIDKLTSYIEANKALQSFSSNNNNLTDSETAKLLRSLSKLNSLISLDLSGCEIGLESLPELKRVLENNKIRVLDLSNTCKYGEISELFSSLKGDHIRNMMDLRLANNGIDDKGAETILSPYTSLPDVKVRVIIDLSSNEITAEGIGSIARHAHYGNGSATINLAKNNFAYPDFLDMLKVNDRYPLTRKPFFTLNLGDDFAEWQAKNLLKAAESFAVNLRVGHKKSKDKEEPAPGLFSAITSYFSSKPKETSKTQGISRE